MPNQQAAIWAGLNLEFGSGWVADLFFKRVQQVPMLRHFWEQLERTLAKILVATDKPR